MNIDTSKSKPSFSTEKTTEDEDVQILPRLSEQLQLEELWEILGDCLTQLAKTPDHHAVLVLQPAVEAFFLVHAGKNIQSHINNTTLKILDYSCI